MPVLWQSSQRPMYVRTVWIDGFRHAILSHDDPYFRQLKRRRPLSSASCNKEIIRSSRLSQRTDLDDCMRKFNYVITSAKSNCLKKRSGPHEEEIEKLNLIGVEPESDDELILKASPQLLYENTGRVNNETDFNMKNLRPNKTARTEVKGNTELSDRVLQWLDLAGKVDLLAPENAERMAQPRHSCPELQRRGYNLAKSRTAIEIRGKINSPKGVDSPKAQQTNIDRHDFYMPTSTNTIENYARQSRNVKSTPRNENSTKTKDKTKSKDLKANVIETRQKMVNERNAVEKQYAELLSKKLIPDVSKSAKRQVHIFMPELPKKTSFDVTSRAESLQSQTPLKSLKP